MGVIEKIREATITGNMPLVMSLTDLAIEEKTHPEQIIQEGLIPAMEAVGKSFAGGEIYVPEMLLAARAMKSGLAIIKPLIAGEKIETKGKIVIGTVKGDMHDIGKNLVSIMFEGSGFEVIDLGVDVPPNDFAQAVQKHEPDMVGLSALLTTTMPQMRLVIDALIEAGLRDRIKVIVGGAPVNQHYASNIGADGYARDAGQAVAMVKELVKGDRP